MDKNKYIYKILTIIFCLLIVFIELVMPFFLLKHIISKYIYWSVFDRIYGKFSLIIKIIVLNSPVIVYLIIIIIIKLIKKQKIKFDWSYRIKIFLIYLVISFLFIFIPIFILSLFNILEKKINFNFTNISKIEFIKNYLITIFYLLVLALGEEIVYRKILIDILDKSFSKIFIIIFTSFLFSLMHLKYFFYLLKYKNVIYDIFHIFFKFDEMIIYHINIFVIGIVFAILKYKTKTIFSSWAYHFFYNFSVTLLSSDFSIITGIIDIKLVSFLRLIKHINIPDFIYIKNIQISLPNLNGLIIFFSNIIFFSIFLLEFIIKRLGNKGKLQIFLFYKQK